MTADSTGRRGRGETRIMPTVEPSPGMACGIPARQADGTYAVQWEAPLVGQALRQLDSGERPADRVLTGALRELRRIRAQLRRWPLAPESADVIFAALDGYADVIAWARDQPIAVPLRLCASCGQRPARFDTLCKRCAGDARPRGKV